MSAYYTSEHTGINIKTVCKYFNEWSEEIEETESSSFLERQKRDRIQTIITYDSLISEAQKLSAQISTEIENGTKENKKIPGYLVSHKIELMKFTSALVEKKATFAMRPPMDDAVEKAIEEKMKKYAQSE